MVTYGADRLAEYRYLLAEGRVALVTSGTGRSSKNISTIELLNDICHVTALLGPEHGVRGDQAAGMLTKDYIDQATGLPVFSLYGAKGKRLRPEILNRFDILVYDIQDVGLRFYTFLSTLSYMVEDCLRRENG